MGDACVLRHFKMYMFVQILFPATYQQTAHWLTEATIANKATLEQCKIELKTAIESHPQFQHIAGGIEVSLQGEHRIHQFKFLFRVLLYK